MEREEVLQAVFKEDWEPILAWLHKRKNDIKKDEHLQFAAGVFAAEYFRKLPTYALDRQDVNTHLATLLALYRGKMYPFSAEHYQQLIVNIAIRSGRDQQRAYQFAQEFPDNEECKKIIEAFEQRQPKRQQHSQTHTIQVTTQAAARQQPTQECRIRLFKSYQEKQFFQAMKNTFPSHQVYPNVAISCLLDWDSLCPVLTPAEKDFFFKGIIDFVIFDQVEDYMPIYFFELDSAWHDSEKAQRNDEAKDGIFTKAGVELRRVKKLSQQVGEKEFTQLIRDLIL